VLRVGDHRPSEMYVGRSVIALDIQRFSEHTNFDSICTSEGYNLEPCNFRVEKIKRGAKL
jgi:hypothetical protein